MHCKGNKKNSLCKEISSFFLSCDFNVESPELSNIQWFSKSETLIAEKIETEFL